MKVIEMLVKGMKAVPMCKTKEWKNRYYLTIEGDKIVKKYIYDEREDFLYDYIDVDWLLDEGVEFREAKRKYYVVYDGTFFLIKDDSVDRVVKNNFVRCCDISMSTCNDFKCNECPMMHESDKRIDLDDPKVKWGCIEY